jgi:hypothetical protein
MDAEFGQPQWFFGSTTFDFWEKDKIVCVYSKNGTDYLGVLLIRGGAWKAIQTPFTSIKNPSISGDKLYFVGGSAQFPEVAIQYDLNTQVVTVLKQSHQVAIDAAYCS